MDDDRRVSVRRQSVPPNKGLESVVSVQLHAQNRTQLQFSMTHRLSTFEKATKTEDFLNLIYAKIDVRDSRYGYPQAHSIITRGGGWRGIFDAFKVRYFRTDLQVAI